MGQLRFPLWEPFVLWPTVPHEGTNYRDAQQDGGTNLLPRCSELIITSTLSSKEPLHHGRVSVCVFTLPGYDETFLIGEFIYITIWKRSS